MGCGIGLKRKKKDLKHRLPQPYCYEATADEKKTKAVFPFSEEGRQQALEWINQQFVEKQDLWAAAERN